MANYLPLEIPWGSQWKDVSFSRSFTEAPATITETGPLKVKTVPVKNGGISMSATLVLPDAESGIALHKAIQSMMTKSKMYAFIFHNHLFQLRGWGYSPTEPTLFELHGISLASLEDLISLLPAA